MERTIRRGGLIVTCALLGLAPARAAVCAPATIYATIPGVGASTPARASARSPLALALVGVQRNHRSPNASTEVAVHTAPKPRSVPTFLLSGVPIPEPTSWTTSPVVERAAIPFVDHQFLLQHTPHCDPAVGTCGRTIGAPGLLDPTRAEDGRASIFFGLEALTREISAVRIANHDCQIEPILVLGSPGAGITGNF